jgi:hypothetical protein
VPGSQTGAAQGRSHPMVAAARYERLCGCSAAAESILGLLDTTPDLLAKVAAGRRVRESAHPVDAL